MNIKCMYEREQALKAYIICNMTYLFEKGIGILSLKVIRLFYEALFRGYA